MPQANPIAKKKLAAQAAYKEAVTAKAKQKKGMFRSGQTSNISKPLSKPKLRYTAQAGNPTNLKVSKYYKGGGNILTCR